MTIWLRTVFKTTSEGLRAMTGKTFVSVEGHIDGYEMVFTADSGEKYRFYHEQDCCEHVYIQDIVGDVNDLVGEPLHVAEQVDGSIPADHDDHYYESYTYTFYKFATRKGYVDVRWIGTSNGYYSESVQLVMDEP